MRTIITALVAATAFADIQNDIERALSNLENDIEDIPRDIDREITGIMEDLECWWADRTPEGSC